ncbi:Sporulation initiation inhibitor protein soj [Bacteroidales bacterium Barb7]|nr:Sporulation initiation inhibitor protein soj [Bacteroidales bacterium Barb7]
MTKVISTINLKGGVGKTSTTIALAEFLAIEHGKKVLLIDLDPQTNATVALIGDTRWKEKNAKGETLLQLFKDKLNGTHLFNIDETIEKNVSNIGDGVSNLDLLPSSLGLIDIQDDIASIPAGRFHLISPVTILKNEISDKLCEYDIVLIDCPPNLGVITLNGILISDYYLIPTIPDHLSTYGIPQIVSRIKSFGEEAKHIVEPLGIILSMYRKTILHNSVIKELTERSEEYPKLFKNKIPLRIKTAGAVTVEDDTHEKNSFGTLKKKYGDASDIYKSLTNELLELL